MRTSFPDLSVAVERVIAQDDLVVGHYKMSGTHLGDFMGAPASGKTFNVEAIDIVRMKDGRMVEHWGVLDAAMRRASARIQPAWPSSSALRRSAVQAGKRSPGSSRGRSPPSATRS